MSICTNVRLHIHTQASSTTTLGNSLRRPGSRTAQSRRRPSGWRQSHHREPLLILRSCLFIQLSPVRPFWAASTVWDLRAAICSTIRRQRSVSRLNLGAGLRSSSEKVVLSEWSGPQRGETEEAETAAFAPQEALKGKETEGGEVSFE